MKCDMAGAATVIASMQAIAALKLPVNVLGASCRWSRTCPAAMAVKLGDVASKARNGKTIEILNTDRRRTV